MKKKSFKSYYDKSCAQLLADKISNVYTSFSSEEFVAGVARGIRGKEFLARQDIFSENLELHLTKSYSSNLAILTRILGSELATSEGMFTHGWWLWPVGRYVERNALLDCDASLSFIEKLTKRFTGEFAVRPLLREYPKPTLKRVLAWSRSDNVHVRRLASEGIRTRLPWAKKLDTFFEYPSPCSKVLWNLRQDPEKFVQKSVGNNINDLFKDDPTLAQSIIDSWKQAGELHASSEWIIRHGMRSLKKQKA